jgi:predicted DNA-binding transcriptional regulator AlpA
MPAETSADPIPELLTERLIRKHFLPIGQRTLFRWISSGQFPRADLAVGGKCRFWRAETVRRWIADRAMEGGCR